MARNSCAGIVFGMRRCAMSWFTFMTMPVAIARAVLAMQLTQATEANSLDTLARAPAADRSSGTHVASSVLSSLEPTTDSSSLQCASPAEVTRAILTDPQSRNRASYYEANITIYEATSCGIA